MYVLIHVTLCENTLDAVSYIFMFNSGLENQMPLFFTHTNTHSRWLEVRISISAYAKIPIIKIDITLNAQSHTNTDVEASF